MERASALYIRRCLGVLMPKWKKNATEFTVGVNISGTRGYQSTIPKPVIEALHAPREITFVLKGHKVELRASKPTQG